jgi:stearoyl-CoA desaturase (delta-9 desaturase)
MFRILAHRINWKTSIFLIGTLFLALTAVPVYLWHYGLDWFQAILFLVMVPLTAMSITLGYHRCFSHRAFQAHWTIRLLTLLFGAAAFENSALLWSSEHRRHHKHVDHDDDPYSINKGFFFAHIGWLLLKVEPEPPFENVNDLKKDRLVMWQHRNIHLIAFVVSFVFPAILGYFWNGAQGALGAFLIGGVARVVVVQHSTFFINSLCHTLGNQPYSTRCTARDSWIMALLTFGEGYHNYHHEFQHDYRNGVKPWQWDPTKWAIWLFSKIGLTRELREVPEEKIREAQRRTAAQIAGAKRGLEPEAEVEPEVGPQLPQIPFIPPLSAPSVQ